MKNVMFRDRADAGQQLAARLGQTQISADWVLGLARGGVPVAYEIATALKIPLEIMIVRKLGVPWHPELAMGAVTSGNIEYLNPALIRSLNISEVDLQQARRLALHELAEREARYRQHLPFPDVTHKTIILVDDGIATGATMLTAIKALQQQQVSAIHLAIPVAPASALAQFTAQVASVTVLGTPPNFQAVGQFYAAFPQVSDQELIRLQQTH